MHHRCIDVLSTLHGYLGKILARYCQELQDVMVRSYQESHVPKKKYIEKSYMEKNLKGSQQNADLYCYTLKFSVSKV